MSSSMSLTTHNTFFFFFFFSLNISHFFDSYYLSLCDFISSLFIIFYYFFLLKETQQHRRNIVFESEPTISITKQKHFLIFHSFRTKPKAKKKTIMWPARTPLNSTNIILLISSVHNIKNNQSWLDDFLLCCCVSPHQRETLKSTNNKPRAHTQNIYTFIRHTLFVSQQKLVIFLLVYFI